MKFVTAERVKPCLSNIVDIQDGNCNEVRGCEAGEKPFYDEKDLTTPPEYL